MRTDRHERPLFAIFRTRLKMKTNFCIHATVHRNRKQSRYRPGVAQRVPGSLGSQI
jgi:hypothetical protein